MQRVGVNGMLGSSILTEPPEGTWLIWQRRVEATRRPRAAPGLQAAKSNCASVSLAASVAGGE